MQKGFKSPEQNRENYTWVYRKDSEPFNTNLINIGVQKFFYTEQDDTETDDRVTEAENSFSDLVQNLRAISFGKVELTPKSLFQHIHNF